MRSGKIIVVDHPASDMIVSCTPNFSLNECEVTVRVTPSNFPNGTQFFVTSHFEDTTFWSNPKALTPLASPDFALNAVITLDTKSITPGSKLQVAVLVYSEDAFVPQTEGNLPLLSDFLPDLVYVVGKLSLSIAVIS